MIWTEHLEVRPFSSEDIGIIYDLYSSEVIMRFMPYDYFDMDAASAHLEKIIADWKMTPVLNQEFLITLRDSGEKIGRLGIHIDTDIDSAMIGWLLLEKEWNKGYATEITKASLDYCFRTLKVHRCFGWCNPANSASRRVFEKCGFRKEAHFLKRRMYIKHSVVSWEDELEYAILKSEYDNLA